MGITLLWKLVTSCTDGSAVAGEVDQRDLEGATVIVDGGWMIYWAAPPVYGLPRDSRESVSVANLANLWRSDYWSYHSATLAWLQKFTAAGVGRIAVAIDGSFSVQKTEESLLRSRGRVADALETERRIVERDDGEYLHKKFAHEGHLARMVGVQLRASLTAPQEHLVVAPVVAEGESDMLSIALYRRHAAAALWGNDSDYLLMLPPAGTDTALVRTTASMTSDISIAGSVPADGAWRLNTYSLQRVHTALLDRLKSDAIRYLQSRDAAIAVQCEGVTLTPHVLVEAALLAGNDWMEHFYDRASLAGALGVTIKDVIELGDMYDVCADYAAGRCRRSPCGKKHPALVAAGAPVCFRWALIHALRWGVAHGGTAEGWSFDMCPGMDIVLSQLRFKGQLEAFQAAAAYARRVYTGDAAFYSSLRVLVDPVHMLGDPYATVAADGERPASTAPIGVITSGAHDAFVALSARVHSEFRDAAGSSLAPLRLASLRAHVLRLCEAGASTSLYSFLHTAAAEQSSALDWVPRWNGAGVGMCRTFAVAGLIAATGALLRMRRVRLDIPAFVRLSAMDTHARTARGGVYHKADAPIEGPDIELKLDDKNVLSCPRVQLMPSGDDADALNIADIGAPLQCRWEVLLALLECAAAPHRLVRQYWHKRHLLAALRLHVGPADSPLWMMMTTTTRMSRPLLEQHRLRNPCALQHLPSFVLIQPRGLSQLTQVGLHHVIQRSCFQHTAREP